MGCSIDGAFGFEDRKLERSWELGGFPAKMGSRDGGGKRVIAGWGLGAWELTVCGYCYAYSTGRE